MRELLRPVLLITAVLVVPIVPFVWFGDALEAKITGWFDPPPAPLVVAALTTGVLASDIFLPIPSSLVCTAAGYQLGPVGGTAASWLGMTLGAVLGFALARRWGRPLAARFSSEADLLRMERLAEKIGPLALVVTRAIPVMAEATVLLLGASHLTWRKFLPAIALSNLGLALAFAALGEVARVYGELPLALAVSISLPLVFAVIARRVL